MGEGLRKGRNWICSDEAELAMACRARRGDRPVLIQPFLEGAGEGCLGSRRTAVSERGVLTGGLRDDESLMAGLECMRVAGGARSNKIGTRSRDLVKMCDWRGYMFDV